MRNKNYRDKFQQGAEGADLEKKQILEDQCRAASETLFKKRRELQKLQKDYDEDARRLMEIKTKQQQLQKQSDDMNNQRDRIEKEIGDQMEKVSRAQKSLQAKLNNVRSVRGQDFENTKENFEILTEVEQVKNKHLLGSL
jgi:septal ring factor EnvC (AmiA/AmiB activator)